MNLMAFTFRIFLAVLLGFFIGLERQLTGHLAGIRTNALVSLGACMFVLFSIIMAATIWCTAAVGALCSAENPLYALAATTVLLAANILLRLVAVRIYPLSGFDEDEHTYKITVVCSEQKGFAIRSSIMKHIAGTRLSLINLESVDVIGDKVEIEATMICGSKKQDETAEKLVGEISLEEGVTKAGWELM